MTFRIAALFALVFISISAFGAALGTAPRSVIPGQVQQIISIDYRQLNNSEPAKALKARVLPEPLKELEKAIRGVGISPERDVDQLTFASFRTDNGLRIIGIAQGTFDRKKMLAGVRAKKIKGTKVRQSVVYPMAGSMHMTLLDANTLLFGERDAVRQALAARDGEGETLNSNAQVSDMIQAVEDGAIWSVLDQAGTQNMMRSALGEAASLGDYDTVKKRLLGSRYTLDFANGVKFNLNVHTTDNMSAAMLSSLVKAGMLVRRMNGSETEKSAMEKVNVESDNSRLRLTFASDNGSFQRLVQTDLFMAVSR